jgi:hypothetical protein
MNNDRFKDKMKKLEKERDEFVEKLTPEDQQAYQQKKDQYSSQTQGQNQDGPAHGEAQE